MESVPDCAALSVANAAASLADTTISVWASQYRMELDSAAELFHGLGRNNSKHIRYRSSERTFCKDDMILVLISNIPSSSLPPLLRFRPA